MITPVLLLAVAAWAIAQGLKVLIYCAINKELDWRYLFASGGMPSSHSALVCACAAGIGMTAGVHTHIFGLAVVVAFVVMYDAANVRKATGEQAKILNYIMKNWEKHQPELFAEELKELIGHTPLQVAAGAILGVLVGVVGGWLFQ